ncbi:MAG: hypothetical protein L3J29_07600 [Cyclobacteriaceae bacterium]|nr:hypothetical protein [Cyclobacteriaceae bacterium]
MFKNSLALFIVVFFVGLGGQTLANTDPPVTVDPKLESDSTNVKNKSLISAKEVKAVPASNANDSQLSFWESEEDIEEDSTSNSALSFNFIYYFIEKFKFQVE